MPWFKVDDGFHCHPKVLRAGNEAVGLYVRCGSYAAQQLTDGFIPEHIALLYGSETLAETLVRAGLWRRTRGGWRMPDYLDYNPSKKQVQAEREKTRERVRKHRESAGKSKDRNGVTNTVTNAVSNTTPSRPVQSPKGTRTDTGSQSPSRRTPRAWADDDDSIDLGIVELLTELTGRQMSILDAPAIRRSILDGRSVKNRAAYVARAIEDNPTKFLPAAKGVEPDTSSAPLKVVPEWCGHCESDAYRWVELADGTWDKCPACNPGAKDPFASKEVS